MPYFDPALAGAITRYQHALTRAADDAAYEEDRAAALGEAARIAHDHRGSLYAAESRSDRDWRRPSAWSKLRPSADEQARPAATAAEIDVMYDNLQVAADLAWRAAELLPDEDDGTARILNTAGRWYDVSDGHERADRFYKALVRRCGTTRIGRAADRNGWFVRVR